MNNNSVLTHNFGNSIIQQRESDGYINATAMCKATGKVWYEYFRFPATQEFLSCLESDTGNTRITDSNYGHYPQLEFIQAETGRYGGTWVHPYIAINLAQWCSAAFALQVSKWVIDWFKGVPNPILQQPQNDHIQELQLKLQILQVQLEIANKHGSSALELSLIPFGALTKAPSPPSAQPQQDEATSEPPSPKEKAHLKAKAWVEILETRDRWASQNGYDVFASDLHFSTAYNEHRIYIGAWVYDFVPHISRSTVARRRIKNKQVEVQLDKASVGRPLLIDNKYPAVATFIAECLELVPDMGCAEIIHRTELEFPGQELPSGATIRRYFNQFIKRKAPGS